MSMRQVYDNFIWRLETITVTETALCPSEQGFESYDPGEHSPAQGSGWLRKFYVRWLGSDEDSAATDSDRREAWHTFRLHVQYPRVHPVDDMYRLILSDRDDIATQLRSDTTRLGYDASNATTDTGLMRRIREGDAIVDSNPDLWRLDMEWRCKVRESEI